MKSSPIRQGADFLSYLGEVVMLLGHGVRRLIGVNRLPPVMQRVLSLQFKFTALDAIPFTLILALAAALMVVVQLELLDLFKTEIPGKLVVAVLVRELGPLLAALVVLARSGTAIVTELAGMRASGEIDALRLRGIDPYDYLVIPRQGGVSLALVCLGQLFVVVALMGVFLFSSWVAASPPTWGVLLGQLGAEMSLADLVVVLLKTLVPGHLIAVIACREGIACSARQTEIPRAVTRAIVRALVAVVLWNVLVSFAAYHLLQVRG